MKIILVATIFLISIQGCGQKSMSQEDFKKAKWINHSKGIDYISSTKSSVTNSDRDSFDIKLRAISRDGVNIEEVNSDEEISEVEGFVIPLIKKMPSGISSGYLRINATEVLKPDFFEIVVYLSDIYDSASAFKNDSIVLVKIPGIETFNFVSKDVAKKMFLEDGNDDWSNVLDINPLPPHISITLKQREWSKNEVEDIKDTILKTISMATEAAYPAILLEKGNSYTIFEFKRL